MPKEQAITTPKPEFTPRDVQIFKDIYDCGGLTAFQISALHYPLDAPAEKRVFPIEQPHSNCQRRLLQLYEHGYLERREQPQYPSRGRKENIHRLSRKGVRLLAQWLGCPVSDLPYRAQDKNLGVEFLEHLVLTNDVRVSLMLAAPKHHAHIVTWYTDAYLKRNPLKVTPATSDGEEKQANLVPDGYFHLHTDAPEPHDYHRFLEIDRGTETGISSKDIYRSWERKVKLYLKYYESGEYTRRFGTRGMCILTVTTGEKRLKNLKNVTESAGGVSRFWFTTFDRISSETVLTEPIWRMAGKEGLYSLIWDKGKMPPRV